MLVIEGHLTEIYSLLMGGSKGEITFRLSERVALLLGDSPWWMMMHFDKLPGDLTPEFIRENQAKSRLDLCERFKELYSKRSGVAHGDSAPEKDAPDWKDYAEAKTLTLLALNRLIELKDSKDIRYVKKKSPPDDKSLSEYLDHLKFSFDSAAG